MKTSREMRIDIHPDPNSLDVCWVDQVKLRLAYGFERAEARKVLATKKAELEIVMAELDRAIRNSPESFQLTKITDSSVEATVLVQDEYLSAKRAVAAAQYEVDMLDTALDAIDDRKHALEDLVRLHLAGYYGEPRAPEGAADAVGDMEKEHVRRKGRRAHASV